MTATPNPTGFVIEPKKISTVNKKENDKLSLMEIYALDK